MSDISQKMRDIAKKLLEDGTVNLVIGWEKGNFWYKSPPTFISRPEDADRLIFDDFCYHNLCKYLIDHRDKEGKIAIFAKGCDSRSIIGMIQDHQIPREKLYIIGIPCPGMKDEKAAVGKKPGAELPEAKKCALCTNPNPLIFDELIGEKVPDREPKTDEILAQVEEMTQDEKYEFWQDQFSTCIRCFACRNVCPVCSCRECCFDSSAPQWLGKAENASENSFYHLTRALHMAGRCVGCGECERVCPMGLPVMLLNRKLSKEVETLFNESPAGTVMEDTPAMNHYRLDDPEEFM